MEYLIPCILAPIALLIGYWGRKSLLNEDVKPQTLTKNQIKNLKKYNYDRITKTNSKFSN